MACSEIDAEIVSFFRDVAYGTLVRHYAEKANAENRGTLVRALLSGDVATWLAHGSGRNALVAVLESRRPALDFVRWEISQGVSYGTAMLDAIEAFEHDDPYGVAYLQALAEVLSSSGMSCG